MGGEKFKDLSVDKYFELLQLRTDFFVVEQNSPYQDVDENYRQSIHLYGRIGEGKIIAVLRILPAGISYPEISLGRVALKKIPREWHRRHVNEGGINCYSK